MDTFWLFSWQECLRILDLLSFPECSSTDLAFSKDIYKQTEGVAMGSPLGPVLVDIIMVELENTMIPRLSNLLYF